MHNKLKVQMAYLANVTVIQKSYWTACPSVILGEWLVKKKPMTKYYCCDYGYLGPALRTSSVYICNSGHVLVNNLLIDMFYT